MSDNLMTIPLSKLQHSPANIRKTDATGDLEELVASIAAHGLLQNLTVQPVEKQNGKPSGKFEVVAGGRRLAALKLLAVLRREGSRLSELRQVLELYPQALVSVQVADKRPLAELRGVARGTRRKGLREKKDRL